MPEFIYYHFACYCVSLKPAYFGCFCVVSVVVEYFSHYAGEKDLIDFTSHYSAYCIKKS